MIEESVLWRDTDELSAEQRELFERLLAVDDEKPATLVPIPRRRDANKAPLSFSQQRLWFLHQLNPASPVYNMPSALRMEGRLDRRALAASLRDIVRRHESLRATFQAALGRPLQIIDPQARVELPLVDLSALAPERRLLEAAALAQDEARRPFNLAAGPLLRALLVKLGEDEHNSLFTMHHIISDGWSTGILVRELGVLYEAHLARRLSPLPELPIQYADFAAWQLNELAGEVLDRQITYWTERLTGAPPTLDLPTDRPRPAVLSPCGGALPFAVSAELADALQVLASSRKATLFMVLLAGFAVLLSRLSGQADIPIGIPIAGRGRMETEGLIGFFVNTLALRINLADDPGSLAIVDRVREETLGAYAHQDLPFEKLVVELHPERSLSHTPIIQVMLGLQNFPVSRLELSGLVLEPLPLEVETSKYEFTLLLEATAAGLAGPAVYNRDLFTAGRVRRMLGWLTSLLAGIAANPSTPFSALPLLSAEEQRQLLVVWNDTGAWTEPPLIPELIRRQAARLPQEVAVAFEGREITYRELVSRAGQLAAHLRAMGVGPDIPVALCLERSVDLVVGIVGTFLAGGAYVPLDPELPGERLAFMLADCRASVLVAAEGFSALPLLQSGRDLRVLHLERSMSGPGLTVTDRELSPSNLAYVIYTSGSTGRPKGVAVEHRQLASYVRSVLQRLDLPAGASFATASTIAADLGNTMIYAALCTGGALHVLSREQARDAPTLAEYLARHAVDCLKLVPSHLSALLAGPLPERVLPRRLLVLGGEASPWSLVERVRGLSPGLRILNHYGPTETTVGVLTWEVMAAEGGENGERPPSIPLGRPLYGARAFIVDRNLRPLPLGLPGELLMGGPQVARGYLGRPATTAERFVPDAWSGVPGERLYRTGDLVRYLPSGLLEFLGRVDDQIKLRGFRVELGEIEAALRAMPGVCAAAVLLRDVPGVSSVPPDESTAKRLVAYLQAGEAIPTPGQIREELQKRLPEVMVPSAFVVLEKWPLNANGKLDRQALLRHEPELPPAATAMAPRNPVEALLADIWRQVLGRTEVGVEDNFFELGGDSILSIQVVSRAAQAGLRLTPRQLFERQTIAGLAEVATWARQATLTGVEDDESAGPVALSPIQLRFFAQNLPGSAHYNHALLLQAQEPGGLQPAALARAVACVVAHHGALRARFEPPVADRPIWRQVLVREEEAVPVPFAWIDLCALPVRLQRAALEAAAARRQEGFDLAVPSLFTAALFTLGGGEPDRLLLAAHHLVVDGVSWRILLEDLETAYKATARRAAPELPARTASLRRWVETLTAYSHSAAAEEQAAFWLLRLAAPVPQLSVDFAAEADTVASAEHVIATLGAAETRELLQEIPRVYRARIQEVLLAALAEALAPVAVGARSGRRLLVDLEGHGRDGLDGPVGELDLSQTVGWLTTVYPLAIDLEPAASPAQTLAAVKEQLRELPANRAVYGALRYLGREEIRQQLAALPRPEVVFNYLGQLDQAVAECRLFGVAPESPGPLRDGRQPRLYPLEINVSVLGGCLQTEWTFSTSRHRRATVEGWCERFFAVLRTLIASRHTAAAVLTPADFPLARLDSPALARVSAAAQGEIGDLYAATPIQQGMLSHTLRSPDSGTYVVQMSLLLESDDLDLAAFERAWDFLVERHPALRTTFLWREVDRPLALVLPRVRLSWERGDWRDLPAGEQESRLRTVLAEDRKRGFDPSAAPLLRFFLIRLGERRYRFVWSHHHLLLDGWSTSILLRELFALYEAEREGGKAALNPLRPFREYAGWLQGQDLEAAEELFRRELAGFRTPTPLGLDAPPDQNAGEPASGMVSTSLDTAATDVLRDFARGSRLTLNTLVAGAWALLLGRYSSLEDVVFGMVASGRSAPLPGIGSMVGLFINTLPTRVRPVCDAPLAGFLSEFQRSQAEVRQFEHAPLLMIQGWCEVPRGMPLFESIFVFENYPVDEMALRQIGARLGASTPESTEQNNYPLTIVASPADASLTLRIVYDTRRFDTPTAARMLSHLTGVLRALPTAAGSPLADVPNLTAAERHQVLVEVNDTAAPDPGDLCLHRAVESWAIRSPHEVAVLWAGGTLSYSELDARADRLARHLRGLGVGPDVVVGICGERSAELIVGLLGILKAGGAYLPLDPSYPPERLAYMVADGLTGALPVLLVEERFAPLFADWRVQASVQQIALDRLAELEESGAVLESGDWPDSAAYVIYTSGSTGRPKGVVVPHRALASYLAWAFDYYRSPGGHGSLVHTSISFDLTVTSLFLPLLWGQRVVLSLESDGVEGLGKILAGQPGLSFVKLTPSHVRLLGQQLSADGLPEQTRALIVGGEALQAEDLALWREGASETVIHNEYGPTETVVGCCIYSVPAGALTTGPLPIGRPIARARIYLLDPAHEPVATGIAGELCVGGPAVTRGYLGRPAETAAKFIPDPWSMEPGSRLYRTGDLARHRPDGSIDYLGRIDEQIKIRGYRVEPGEIEAVLVQCSEVQEAAVVAAAGAAGPKRLVAFWVAAGEAATTDGLRAALRERLPEHMVPAIFVQVAALPQTPNGKVDRRALLQRAKEAESERPAGVATLPRSPHEELLMGILAAVLRRSDIGVHDNFFELGGDSILALQVVSRAQQAGLWLAPRDLFRHQTVAELAAVVRAAPGAPKEEEETGDIPLSPIQLWFFELDLADPGHFNQSMLLSLQQAVGFGALEKAFHQVANHHAALGFRFVWDAVAGWRQVRSTADMRLGNIDLSALPPPQRTAALDAAATQLQASLDLQNGPLLRGALFALGMDGERLFLTLHHLVVDGVSWRILLGDLEMAYRALAAGGEAVLPPAMTSFRQWSARLAAHARDAATTAELEGWLAASCIPVRPLPLDRPEGNNIVASARAVIVELEAETTRALLQEVPKTYHSQINDALLTALVQALAAWVGEPRLLLDLEGHGREDLFDGVDVSRTVGWFTSIFPVLLELERRVQSPGEHLKSIKEQLRTIPRRGIGYGLLRYLGDGEVTEQLRATPVAQVIFNYLGQLDLGLPAGSLFALAFEPRGAVRSPRQKRSHLLEITSGIVEGRLRLVWNYSENLHDRRTIEALADHFLGCLRSLVAHCRNEQIAVFTPSDFPEAEFSQYELGILMAGLMRSGTRPEDIETVYELSPMQEAMHFHSLYAPRSGAYLIQMSLRLRGPLDVAAFARAWQEVMDRHGVLRTSFHGQSLEHPVQVVHRHVDLAVAAEPWRGLTAAEQQARLERYLEADLERGFDLSAPPLMRLALFELDGETHQLVWSQHHLLLDGWSQGILLKDLFTCYAAFASGQEPALGRSRSYRDYIAWLRQQEHGQAEVFWRQSLAGFERPTFLTTDGGRHTTQTSPRDVLRLELRLSADTTAALRGMARRHRLTLNTLVQGAWALLLARASGERDVVFGSTVAGRPADLAGAESIVGVFINTLPVRAQTAPGCRLGSWLAELQERQVEARRYEYALLINVQRWSELPAGIPLFDHILVFENYPSDGTLAGLLPDLTISEVTINNLTHYAANLLVAPGAELSLVLLHDVGRFDSAAAARTLSHLATLLTAFPHAASDQLLAELPSLTAAERHQIMVEWNGAEAAQPASGALVLRLAEWAALPAVVHRDETLTYQSLAGRVGALARLLQHLGVGPDVPVGICLERSPEMVIAVLGILQAGGACVPLDLAYPRERLAFMLDDAFAGIAAPVILTQKRLASRVSDLAPAAHVFCVDSAAGTLPEEIGTEAETAAGHLAYVIYTSGSTGRPKGVALTRGALANLLAWQESETGLGRPASTLQFASLSFDVSFQEILSTVRTGGTLHLVDEATRRDAPALLDLIARSGIERLFLPFVALGQLAEVAADREERSCQLCDIITAGEQLHITPALAQWLAAMPGCRLHNHYGPSETHVVTAATLAGAPESWPLLPAIGRPVANTQAYVLGADFAPVPQGAPGELYLAGVQLARGYLHRPALTAERFVPDPFRGPGERLYQTGDLARHRNDGEIEYLGRIDGQVKIRGFRVELAEVEAALVRHPAVREAAVTAPAEPGERTRRLVAYVVGEAGTAIDRHELRRFLAGELPEHMVPAVYVVLDVFPLTPSGKLDRRALPAPEPDVAEVESAAPRSPFEEMIAEIWESVLGGRVGIHDDFFSLGGHSLNAVQVMARVRAAVGIEVPLATLFAAPTVAGLAAAVNGLLRAGDRSPAPPILPVPREHALPLSFSQQRLWFLHQMEPMSAAYNIPAALRLAGRLDVAALAAAFSEVVRRHEALRTTFDKQQGEPVQFVGPPAPMPLPCVDLRALPDAVRASVARDLVQSEAGRPFDLAHGPLLRALLITVEAEEHALVAAMHHIVSDGWSIGVLIRELGALYGAFTRRRPSPLPDLPVQYGDFACWQRSWLAGETLAAELAHWRGRLAGSPVLEMPTDRPRPAVQSLRGAGLSFLLPEPLRRDLRRLASNRGATLFTALLAAFDTLLHRYSGQDDIVVGTPVASRTRTEIEGLIGFFINSLVLRVDLSGDPSFDELLQRAKRAALDAFAHQDLPFEKIVEELQPKRSLSHSPLYQAALSLSIPMAPLLLPGLTLTPLPLAGTTAKLDLILAMAETADGLSGQLEYSRDLFEASTLERFIGHFRSLLEHSVAEPARRLADLPLLGGAEWAQLLTEWNDTAKACPQEPLVHELFAAYTLQQPAAVAVASRQRQMTYGELEAKSNRLAHHLRALGVGPEVLVAICTDRTLERVVGIVATLKAGGAYVSLDPTYPHERLAFLLEDARAPVLLTEERFVEGLPASGARILCLDGCELLSGREDAPPQSGVRPDHLAYVVYTSGSTGRPKGVEIPHAGLMNLVRWHQDLYAVRPGDRGTQVASPAFDASIWELWPYLAGGASLYLPDEETRLSSPGMIRWWSETGITLAYLMTPLAEGVLEQSIPPGLDLQVRALIIGGDRLHRRPAPGVGFRLMNHYGPAEYTVTSTVVEVPPEGAGPARITIGRAVDNTEIYVLGRRGEPVPIGVPGELYVGGMGLARGYLRRPDLTAEKFLPHPWSAVPGARLYRTGDLVRYLPDGDLDFLGRLDHQVKIRGLRIELGEIESTLGQHPGLREVVVLAREDRPGDKRLVAYALPAEERRPTDQELRGFLRSHLPEYMVPTAFIFLDTFPLTPNGKVDRRALPAPETAPEAAYIPPRGPMEQTLATLWREVLGLERIGREDNFFDLGGHSLLLVRLRDRLQETLGREVPMLDMFQYTTLQTMAAHLAAPAISEALSTAAETADTVQAGELQKGRDRREQMRRRREETLS
jgi:amino acid adenylation domain-containing protein/non-ribosomal peptide synthase protein (TIGR01720 family)